MDLHRCIPKAKPRSWIELYNHLTLLDESRETKKKEEDISQYNGIYETGELPTWTFTRMEVILLLSG